MLYLHNAAESWLAELGYRRFIEKLWEVFTLYEEERKRGRILYYGMATWSCLRVSEGESRAREPGRRGRRGEGASAERSTASGSCSFPFNVAMNEALTQKNQRIADEPLTTFEAAKRLGVGVFTSVPLSQGRLLSHTRVPELEGSKALSLIQFARSAHPAVVGAPDRPEEPGARQGEPPHRDDSAAHRVGVQRDLRRADLIERRELEAPEA